MNPLSCKDLLSEQAFLAEKGLAGHLVTVKTSHMDGGISSLPAHSRGTFLLPAKIPSQKSLMDRFALQKLNSFLRKTISA